MWNLLEYAGVDYDLLRMEPEKHSTMSIIKAENRMARELAT
jgi:hypothetical protein